MSNLFDPPSPNSRMKKRRIYESGNDTRELFRVEIAEDGYFAVRGASPKFAFFGASITEVVRKAERAFAFIKTPK